MRRVTTVLPGLLLGLALAAPAWSDPPKVPLFGRHKKAAVAPPPAAAPADPAAAEAPAAASPPVRPADAPIGTVDVPGSAAAAPADPAPPPAVSPAPAAPAATAPAGPAPADPVAPAAQADKRADLRAAYAFALPVYEMMRTRQLQVSKVEAMGAPGVNHLYARTALADATTRDVTTPNNDTLYSSAWLDLAGGPVILDTPAIPGRYHSAALMDLYTDNVAIVGTRGGGRGGRYLIAGPGWTGTPPPQTTVLRSPTNDAWLLVRVLVNGPDDLAAATGLIRGFSLSVTDSHAPPVPVRSVPTAIPDAATFLAVVDEALARNPLPDRARAFAALNLAPGAPASPETIARWDAALPALRAEVKGGLAETGTTVDGWTYPGEGIGQYGDRDDAARACVALGGLGALPRTEAVYLTAKADAAGAPLTGAKAYTVHLPPKLPVGAFWSLTMYEQDAGGRLFFVDTPSKRFAVGDRTPELRPNADGSYDIFVQPAAPSGERVVNWLPSPKGRFVLIFRAYLPGPAFLNGSFRLPPVAASEVIP
ncbi:MAG: DUF1254 domain-containing protein [Sphingomonadaceae bacterium]|nr:DUF1254 domain-containing protein [Sphingomonadaceae bacterium]